MLYKNGSFVKSFRPAVSTAEGGMTGCYLRTTGRAGRATLTVSAPGLEAVTAHFTVKK